MNLELEKEYKKENGFDVGKIHDTSCTFYSEDYVKWLESKVVPKSKTQSITVTLHPSDGKKEQEFLNSGTKVLINYPCCDEQNKTKN